MIDPQKKKLLIIISIIVGLVVIVSIVIAIIMRVNENSREAAVQPTVTTYTDPYSGETITYTEGKVGEKENSIVYFGFSKLLQYGMTNNQVSYLKEYIRQYSDERVEFGQERVKEITIDFKTYRQIMSEQVRGSTVEFIMVVNRDEKQRFKFVNSSVNTNELTTIIYSTDGAVAYDSDVNDHEH